MINEKDADHNKRGYLKGDFELFHIKDSKNLQFEFHYHDFNKIIVFISGNVTYLIEGKSYKLKPWDILLVNSREVHKAVIESEETYERIIIWVNQVFLEKHSSSDCSLLTFFELALNRNYHLLRLNPELLRNIKSILAQLEEACRNTGFGSHVLKNALVMQLIVQLNRLFLGTVESRQPDDYACDDNISAILKYINENLGKNLSIDSLSSRFYMSRYYLMHRFKEQTGYTVHSYILQKRLIMAHSLIKNGKPIHQTSIECGFGDYSSFVRAFKKMFGLSPRNYYKKLVSMQESYKSGRHFNLPRLHYEYGQGSFLE